MTHSRNRTNILIGLVTALALSSPAFAVEPLDEDGLESLHLEGLDAPAAGGSRSAVYGDVADRSRKELARELTDEATAGLSPGERSLGPGAIIDFQSFESRSVTGAGPAGVVEVQNIQSGTQVIMNSR